MERLQAFIYDNGDEIETVERRDALTTYEGLDIPIQDMVRDSAGNVVITLEDGKIVHIPAHRLIHLQYGHDVQTT